MKTKAIEQLDEKIIIYLNEIREKKQYIEKLETSIVGLKKDVSRCNSHNKKLQNENKELQDKIETFKLNKEETSV